MLRHIITLLVIIIIAIPFGKAHAFDLGQAIGSAITGAQQLHEAAKEITPSEEHYIGRAVAAMVLAKYPLLGNAALDAYVSKVGTLVAYRSEHPVTYGGYHFAVLNSSEANAFACPGGFIFITKGLLKTIENEDQLANVLGHEVTHVAKRHGIKAIKKARWTKFAFFAAGEVGKQYTPSELTQLTQAFQSVVTDVAKQVIDKGYSKKDERQADDLGMRYAALAGYDPQAMATFIQHEIALGMGEHSGPFSSHPTPKNRLKQVDSAITAEHLAGTVASVRTARYKRSTASVR